MRAGDAGRSSRLAHRHLALAARRQIAMKRLATPVAALLLCAAGAQPCLAWGFTAHRLVNRRAIATLPPELRALFEANADYLAEHSIDADLRRLTSSDPDHFLDMDAFGPDPARSIPRDEAAHLARHGAEAREKGRLPWRAGEAYRELVAAFAARDPARILERAAELGHFVGDAHVPLHAVLNYDGQLTEQTGLHNRWESELVERFEQQLAAQLAPPALRRVNDPVGAIFEVLLGLLQRGAARAGIGPPQRRARATSPTRPRTTATTTATTRGSTRARAPACAARLAAGIGLLGSLWQSAWQDAGRPALPSSFRFPYVRGAARAVVVSLDGAGASLVSDALARGLMPTLARLRSEGAAASGSLPSLPTKTAASHAALYTGAWSDRQRDRRQRPVRPGRVDPRGRGRLLVHAPGGRAALGHGGAPGPRGHGAVGHPGLSVRALPRREALRAQLRLAAGAVRRIPERARRGCSLHGAGAAPEPRQRAGCPPCRRTTARRTRSRSRWRRYRSTACSTTTPSIRRAASIRCGSRSARTSLAA